MVAFLRPALARTSLQAALVACVLFLDAAASSGQPVTGIIVDKLVEPLSRPAPGGAFTFTVGVFNSGTDPVTLATLNDDVYGDLTVLAGSSCSSAPGTVLLSGDQYICSFTGDFTGSAGASETDTVTATATPTDPNQQPVQDSDDATATLTAATAIAVDKTAEPLTLPAPGGAFTFSVVVTNTGSTTVEITALTDDIYGDLTALGTCTDAVGTVLIAGATYSCSFPGNFTGTAGASQTDTVTATASDPQSEEEVTASASATVTLGPARSIAVDKTVAPSSLDAPGGTFTFSVLVTNTGDVTLTIVAVGDDIYGDLTTRPGSTCDTALGTSLAPDETYNCSFSGDFNGAAGASQTDTVTVTALDGEDSVTGADDATVTLTQPPFAIDVDKSVLPLTRPEPGGAFTFTVVVTNTGSQQVTLSALTDDVYGNLTTLPGSTCSTATGTVLDSGATYSCSFTVNFAGNAGDSQTDTVTATATGPEPPTLVTGADDAVVSLTDVLPAITVDKSVLPPSLPAPGGAFTFTVLVTNTGAETVSILGLTDDVYGDLGTVAPGSTCNTAPGTVLAPSGTYSCSFTRQFTGSAGAQQTDTVTAVVRDDESNQANASDTATVSLTGPGLAEIPTLDAKALALLAVALAALGIAALRRRAG